MPDDVLVKDHVGMTAGFVIGEGGVLVIELMLNEIQAAKWRTQPL
jgi:hypothetical protein